MTAWNLMSPTDIAINIVSKRIVWPHPTFNVVISVNFGQTTNGSLFPHFPGPFYCVQSNVYKIPPGIAPSPKMMKLDFEICDKGLTLIVHSICDQISYNIQIFSLHGWGFSGQKNKWELIDKKPVPKEPYYVLEIDVSCVNQSRSFGNRFR